MPCAPLLGSLTGLRGTQSQHLCARQYIRYIILEIENGGMGQCPQTIARLQCLRYQEIPFARWMCLNFISSACKQFQFLTCNCTVEKTVARCQMIKFKCAQLLCYSVILQTAHPNVLLGKLPHFQWNRQHTLSQ